MYAAVYCFVHILAENDDGYKAKPYAAFSCNFREIVLQLLLT